MSDGTEDDTKIVDWMGSIAKAKGCGWNVDGGGMPYLKHWSQSPQFATLREAFRSLDEEGA